MVSGAGNMPGFLFFILSGGQVMRATIWQLGYNKREDTFAFVFGR